MSVAERLATLDWPVLEAGLWERGWASANGCVRSGTRHTLGITFHDAE